VRRTVGRARMMAAEVNLPGRQKEEMIDIPDELTGGEQHVKVNIFRYLTLVLDKTCLVLFCIDEGIKQSQRTVRVRYVAVRPRNARRTFRTGWLFFFIYKMSTI